MTIPIGDLISLETADGQFLYFPDEIMRLPVYGSFGMPPTDFITRRGYKQDGVTEIDYTLSPRALTVELWRAPACDRDTYWLNRAEFIDFLRPNRGGPITFTLRRPDSTSRSIIVRANPGLEFPPQSVDENNWDIREQIEFIAFDPIWFNTSATNLSIAGATDSNLVFPITFPILFGTAGLLFSSGNIAYAGNWKSYPTLTLTGPYSVATLTNLTTNVQIFMTVPLIAAEQRIIDLTPGSQSIVDGFGVSHFGDLGPLSNLVDFNLRPDPEVAGGVNIIQAALIDGAMGVSAFSMSYYNRYLGI